MRLLSIRALALLSLLLPGLAAAADLDGSQLSIWWGLPFAGVLLSIALVPLVAPMFWHHHFGKVSAAWALAFLVPFAITFGAGATGAAVAHAALAEYIPFIILLTALFTVAGGIFVCPSPSPSVARPPARRWFTRRWPSTSPSSSC